MFKDVNLMVALLKYVASLNVLDYTSYFLLKSHRRLSRSFAVRKPLLIH